VGLSLQQGQNLPAMFGVFLNDGLDFSGNDLLFSFKGIRGCQYGIDLNQAGRPFAGKEADKVDDASIKAPKGF
jgi:hypothetical protein